MTEQIRNAFVDDRARIFRKAKEYRHEIIDGKSYIAPCSDEIEEVRIDSSTRRSEYMMDFLLLLTRVSKARVGFILPILREDSDAAGNNEDTKGYYASLEECGTLLAEFYTKWGPFGIFGSRMHASHAQSNGGIMVSGTYEKVVFDPNYSQSLIYMQRLPFDGIPVGVQAYDDVAKHFFPKINTAEKRYPQYGDADFYSHYSEQVTTVLSDVRFCDMLFHFEKWSLRKEGDFSDYTSLIARNVGIEVTRIGNTWELNAYGGMLIQLTQVFYMFNLLQQPKHVAICKHTTCRTPFISDSPRAEYCCPEHAVNARKMRYRKRKEAQQETANGKTE